MLRKEGSILSSGSVLIVMGGLETVPAKIMSAAAEIDVSRLVGRPIYQQAGFTLELSSYLKQSQLASSVCITCHHQR